MKKMLKFMLFFVLVTFLLSCENNKGPFEIRKEEGTCIIF